MTPSTASNGSIISRVSEKIFIGAILLSLPVLGGTAVIAAVNSNRVSNIEEIQDRDMILHDKISELLHNIDVKLTLVESIVLRNEQTLKSGVSR